MYDKIRGGKTAIHMKELFRKICVLGDPAVGKTSLIRRYVIDIFDDKYIPSVGMKVTKKLIYLDEGSLALTLMIWDILGSKTRRFDSIYYKGVEGALIVCDVTREKTVDSVSNWITGMFEITGEVPVVFLANKIDLEKASTALKQQMSIFARSFKTESMYTSAKTGENVEDAFLSLAKKIVSKREVVMGEKNEEDRERTRVSE
ncbi:MAG: GTP-binding protein [Thermoplasmata archaeon]|nr:MAG: GTP-binding protein [Thermoplasmata archaeon]